MLPLLLLFFGIKTNFPPWHRSINPSLWENVQTSSGGAHRKSMERCKRVSAHPEFTVVWIDVKKLPRVKTMARNVCLLWAVSMKTQQNNNNNALHLWACWLKWSSLLFKHWNQPLFLFIFTLKARVIQERQIINSINDLLLHRHFSTPGKEQNFRPSSRLYAISEWMDENS